MLPAVVILLVTLAIFDGFLKTSYTGVMWLSENHCVHIFFWRSQVVTVTEEELERNRKKRNRRQTRIKPIFMIFFQVLIVRPECQELAILQLWKASKCPFSSLFGPWERFFFYTCMWRSFYYVAVGVSPDVNLKRQVISSSWKLMCRNSPRYKLIQNICLII